MSEDHGTVELRNRWVHFRIRDVHIPDPEEVLVRLYGNDLLQGRVIDCSDSAEGRYLVVQVQGFPTALVVPEKQILGVV